MEGKTSRWEQIRSQKLADPEMRSLYERRRRTFVAIRRVIETIEQRRSRIGMTKAELARQVGANPAAIRRLLTSDEENPTLQTLVSLCDALGLEIVVRPCGNHEMPSAGSESPTQVVITG